MEWPNVDKEQSGFIQLELTWSDVCLQWPTEDGWDECGRCVRARSVSVLRGQYGQGLPTLPARAEAQSRPPACKERLQGTLRRHAC